MRTYKRDLNVNLSEAINEWWSRYDEDYYYDNYNYDDGGCDCNICRPWQTDYDYDKTHYETFEPSGHYIIQTYRGMKKIVKTRSWYRKVDMESFYDKPMKRKRRIEKVLGINQEDTRNLLGDYFNN